MINKNLSVILLMAALLSTVSCQRDSMQIWANKGPLIEKRGLQFLKQNKFLTVVRRNNGSFSFLTPQRIILIVDFSKNEYSSETVVGRKTINTLEEIERKFQVSRSELHFWVSALEELNSFLISKDEVYCDLHISDYSEAPLGARSRGWFYFIDDKQDTPRQGFRRIMKVKEGWYWGISDRS